MMSAMAEPLAVESGSLAPASDFGGWVLSEQKRVFLLCLRMLQDSEEADSATQDVFMKAYKALQSRTAAIDEPSRWLTRIAVNTCLDRLRSRRWQFWRKRPGSQDEALILGSAKSGSPDAEDQMFARQIEARLQASMIKLSDRQKAVFTLKHFEDHSLEEIGAILGLDVGTVKAHMSRAVAKLRVELADLYKR
jgi:RNA polymerase sigma-70 factor (ECF subfamily)